MYVGTEIYRTVCDVFFNLNYTMFLVGVLMRVNFYQPNLAINTLDDRNCRDAAAIIQFAVLCRSPVAVEQVRFGASISLEVFNTCDIKRF